MKIVKDLFLAISFLTILPFAPFGQPDEIIQNKEDLAENFANSMIYFPFVGLLIGAVLVLFNHLIDYLSFSSLLNNALILLIWVCLSGGLHLDGFTDMVDGFAGGNNKDDILRIMKDSAIGAKGAIALFFILLLKFVLLGEIDLSIKFITLLFIPALSRWSMIAAAFFGKPAYSENSMGQQFMKYLGKKELILSTIIIIIPGIILFKFLFLALLGITIGVIWLLLKYCQGKIGGITGDILGALNEIVELCCLLVLCLF